MIRKILFLLPMLLLAAPAFADSQGSATGGTSATQSTAAGCRYNSSQPTLVNAQQVMLQCDVNGNLLTSGGGGGGGNVNLTGINGVTPLVNSGAPGAGSPRATVAQDTTTVAGAAPLTTGIYVTGPSAAALATAAAQTTSNNFLSTISGAVGSIIPQACTQTVNISQATTTDVLTSTNKLHICTVVLVSTTAQNIGLDEGTGTICETSGTALIGVSSTASATPKLNALAGSGFVAVSGIPWLQTKTAGDHLCVLEDGAGQVSGTITYYDQ